MAPALEPSLPNPSPSLSYWHRTTRGFPHLHANQHARVPDSIEYVVIGAGIAGAVAAWELIHSGVKGSSVLLLEAREAVSGASGRNAGHIRPDAFRGFPAFSKKHGPQEAIKILANEMEHLNRARDFITKYNVDCDFNYTTTVEVCLSQDYADFLELTLEDFKAAGGDASHITVYKDAAAKAKSRSPAAVAAYEWPAGSNHPGKLTQWILSDCIKKGARLWTHCPAVKINRHKPTSASAFRWDIHTPRGILNAQTIVHCTNAWAAFLLPQLSDFISPSSSQVHTFIPTASLSSDNLLNSTISRRYHAAHFFSINPRVTTDGTIIMGGTATMSDDEAKTIPRTTYDESLTSKVLENNARNEFLRLSGTPTEKALRLGEGLEHTWSGILGMTPDSVPLIGAIDGLEGQWICAAFNGHGMARMFTCAPGLVKLMTGHDWASTGLPECFRYTKERIEKPTPQAQNAPKSKL